MRFQPVQQAYAKAVGFTSTSNLVIENRNPTSFDTKYPIGQFWLNPIASALWFLNSQSSANAILQSEWIELEQDMSAVETFTVDAETAPGTNPVVPDGSNNINVTGGQTAPGTIANVIRTNSLAANTWTTQIQQTSTSVAKNTALNGVSHFNSGDFTNDEGFISLSGSGVGQTLTAQTGGPLSPTAGNWNIFGLGETSTSGSVSTVSILSPRVAKFVVDPVLNVGTHQTITAALAAAVSGETIFVRPGTYTENPSLKAGVDIVSFDTESQTPNVTIIGKLTASYAGTATIGGIRIQTNGDNCVSVTGASTILNLTECYVAAVNNTAISVTNGMLNFLRSNGDTTTTATAFFVLNGGGCFMQFSQVLNSGNSSAQNINTDANLIFNHSDIATPITVAGAGSINAYASIFFSLSGPALTQNSSAVVEMNARECFFASATTSAISVGSGAQITVDNSTIRAAVAAGIAGAGSVKAAGIVFEDGATSINAASVTTLATFPLVGKIIQQARQSVTGLATTTSVIPTDDTLPQSSEGDEFTTLSITPIYASSALLIEFNAMLGITTGGAAVTLALFRDSSTDASCARFFSVANAGDSCLGSISCSVSSATAGVPTTFKIRYGTTNAANAANINGTNSTHYFSTAMQATFTITEIQA
jgi:hypothetical protein